MSKLVALLAIAAVAALSAADGALAKPPTTFNPVVEAQNFSITPAAPDDLRHAAVPSCSCRGQRGRATTDGARRRRPPTLSAASPTISAGTSTNGCAGDIRLYDWASQRLRDRAPGPVHRARRRNDLRSRVGHRCRPGEAARNRDHRRLGPSRRADVLVRGAGARQGRLRGVDLRSSGPGAERHVRPGAGRRTRAFPPRPTDAPSTTGPRTRSTSCSRPLRTRTRRCPVCSTGTSHAAKQNARVAAGSTRPTTRSGSCSTPREIGLAGHSYGAAGVSYVAPVGSARQSDRGVGQPRRPGPNDALVPGAAPERRRRRSARPVARRPRPTARPWCRSRSRRSGISADYGLPPTPNTVAARPERQVGRGRSTYSAGRRRHAARSSSAAARTSTSASSRTRRSARRCAGRT